MTITVTAFEVLEAAKKSVMARKLTTSSFDMRFKLAGGRELTPDRSEGKEGQNGAPESGLRPVSLPHIPEYKALLASEHELEEQLIGPSTDVSLNTAPLSHMLCKRAVFTQTSSGSKAYETRVLS